MLQILLIQVVDCSWNGTETAPAPQPFVHMPSCSFSTQTSAFVKRLMCRSCAKGHTFVHMHVCVRLLQYLTKSRCSFHCEISINSSFFHYYIKNPEYFSPISREWSYIIQWVTVKIKLENIFIKFEDIIYEAHGDTTLILLSFQLPWAWDWWLLSRALKFK